jgi:hypothetical protein
MSGMDEGAGESWLGGPPLRNVGPSTSLPVPSRLIAPVSYISPSPGSFRLPCSPRTATAGSSCILPVEVATPEPISSRGYRYTEYVLGTRIRFYTLHKVDDPSPPPHCRRDLGATWLLAIDPTHGATGVWTPPRRHFERPLRASDVRWQLRWRAPACPLARVRSGVFSAAQGWVADLAMLPYWRALPICLYVRRVVGVDLYPSRLFRGNAP